MKLSVAGLGIVSKTGTTQDIEELLTRPEIILADRLSGHTLPIDFPDEFNIASSLVRRMSHFAKISLLSACYAMKDSGFDLTGKSVGIIQGSVYGPIISGIQAFDDLIDFGDNQLSPTNFSGSVFNTSATYLSLAFGIQGCTLSHTSGLDTLYRSLQTAALWLESGISDYVVLGIGDEYAPYFDHNFLPSDQQSGLLPTCEGWTTFILSRDEGAKYGKIDCDYLATLPETKDEKVVYSIWHDQIKHDDFLNHTADNNGCFPIHLRGSYPSASAFDLAFALICRKKRRFPINQPQNDIYRTYDLTGGERIHCVSPADHGNFYRFRI